MPNFRFRYKGLFQSPYVLHLPRNNESFDWPQEILEQIVGIPDILNEVLADNICEQNKNKAKLNDRFYQERSRLRADSGGPKDHRGTLVGRAYLKLLQKSV